MAVGLKDARLTGQVAATLSAITIVVVIATFNRKCKEISNLVVIDD